MTEWSSLEAEARKRTRERGPRCAVEVFLSHLSTSTRRLVAQTLMDPNLTTVGIQRAIAAKSLDAPSEWSIRNHRRGKCRCSR